MVPTDATMRRWLEETSKQFELEKQILDNEGYYNWYSFAEKFAKTPENYYRIPTGSIELNNIKNSITPFSHPELHSKKLSSQSVCNQFYISKDTEHLTQKLQYDEAGKPINFEMCINESIKDDPISQDDYQTYCKKRDNIFL